MMHESLVRNNSGEDLYNCANLLDVKTTYKESVKNNSGEDI